MRTPAELDEALSRLFAERAACSRKLADLTEEIDRLEAERAAALPGREQRRTVNAEMVTAHRVAISEGRSGDPLAVAARRVKLTVRSLAKRVGTSPAQLSMARKGERPISRDLAERIERLTRVGDEPGFAASKKNWPRLD